MREVLDVEVYHNVFTCTSINFDTDEVTQFEISARKNDLIPFVEFIKTITYCIGFNIMHYDNPIIMYLVRNVSVLSKETSLQITERLKVLSDCIIGDDEGTRYREYSKYKYPPYVSIDLFMYWSKLTRISRKMSLKGFEVALNWPRVQELPIHHTAYVRDDQIDELLDYNLNDSAATKALAKRMSKDINLRVAAQKKFGFPCLSWDGVKLGLNIIIRRYCQRTGLDEDVVRGLRSPRASIDIGEIILPQISFKTGDTSSRRFTEDKKIVTEFKSFYGLWQYLRTLVVVNTKSINCRVFVGGIRYDIKSGGLHSYHNAALVVRKDGYRYVDKDVSSMYPTISCMWGIGPEHLGSEAPEELDTMRVERLNLKAIGLGKSADAELGKLSMNGGWYGNMNNEYTPMYDPKGLLGTTINGQLFLLMFCEALMDVGATIDMVNTDGVTIMYPEHLHEEVERVSKEWETLSRMQLEAVNYVKVVRKDINNYLAFYEDHGQIKVKEKGMFLTNPDIDMSRDFLVISKAVRAYFEFGTPVEEFIRSHSDIYDFCASMKVDKSYTVFHNGKEQQRLNRYFINSQGAYLYKSKDGVNMEHMMKGWTVELFNNYYDVPMKDYRINYQYYISKTKEILNEFEPRQTSLF